MSRRSASVTARRRFRVELGGGGEIDALGPLESYFNGGDDGEDILFRAIGYNDITEFTG